MKHDAVGRVGAAIRQMDHVCRLLEHRADEGLPDAERDRLVREAYEAILEARTLVRLAEREIRSEAYLAGQWP